MEKQEKSSLVKKIKDNVKSHLVDSTAILAESTPIFAGFETGIAGMSNDVSMNTRLFAVGLTYLGLGYVYGKGRDIWRNSFKVTDKTNEKTQHLCDAAYTAAFNLVVSPPMYLACGAKDAKEIAIGTLCAIGFGAINGGPTGYAIDFFRDLVSMKDSERIPTLIKKQNRKVKLGLAALLVGSSIALTAGIYSSTSDNKETAYQQQTPQQVIENTKIVKLK